MVNEVTVTESTILYIETCAFVLAVLPLIFIAGWKLITKKKSKWKPLFIGAAGFIVCVRILELAVHMVCVVMDNPISRVINGNTVAYVIYGITMAGVFEEVGRHVIISKLMKKNKTRENMVMYGIGHGGCEVWAVSLMSMVSYLMIGIAVASMGLETALAELGVTADQMDAVMPTVNAIATFGMGSTIIMVVERIFAMLAHIALTLIVFYGIEKKEKNYLFYAIGAHMVLDIFPALLQRGVVSVIACEIWVGVCALLLVVWARKLYGKMNTYPEETIGIIDSGS